MTTGIIPLNKFINVAAHITTSNQPVYTAKPGVSSIILSAICSNRTNAEVTVSVMLRKTELTNNVETNVDEYLIAPNIPIPANDVLSIILNKAILTVTNISIGVVEVDELVISASENDAVDFIMSINEAANE